MSVSIGRLRGLAGAKGLSVERHQWRDRVRIICSNGASLRWYPDGYPLGHSAFQLRHTLRFLLGLPDVD